MPELAENKHLLEGIFFYEEPPSVRDSLVDLCARPMAPYFPCVPVPHPMEMMGTMKEMWTQLVPLPSINDRSLSA